MLLHAVIVLGIKLVIVWVICVALGDLAKWVEDGFKGRG